MSGILGHRGLLLSGSSSAPPDGLTQILRMRFESLVGGVFVDDEGNTVSHSGSLSPSAAAAYEGSYGLEPGSGPYIALPSFGGTGNTDFNFGADDFEITFAHQIATVPGAGNYRSVIAKDDVSTTRGWLAIVDGDIGGKMHFAIFDGATAYSVVSTGALTTGVWRKWRIKREGNALTLALWNGSGWDTHDTEDVTGVSVNDTNSPLMINALKNGGSVAGASYHAGYIDDLTIKRGF